MKKVVFLMNIKSLRDNGYSAEIIWWYGILEKFGYEVFYEDYAEYDEIEFYNKMKHYKPDFIFHLAAQALVSKSYMNPTETISTNVIGTMNLLEVLRKIKIEIK